MNLYKYIEQKIQLKEIEKLPKDRYEIAIVRSTLKNLSNLFYRDYTFFLNKENLIDAVSFGNKVSSIAVQRKGAQPSIPYLKEVKEVYGDY